MKPGFSILEILVALALGTFIGSAIFTSFMQVNRGYKVARQVVDLDFKMCVVQHQLDRDLSGAFIPFSLKKKKEESASSPVDGKKTGQKREEKVETPLKDGFLSKVTDGNTTLFSFVTSNPLSVYGHMVPRVARVVYQLIPEKQRSGEPLSYALFRTEYKELPFEEPKEKSSEGIKVIGGIKSMLLEYEVKVAEEKEGSKEKEGEKKPEEFTYETTNVWSEEHAKKFKRNLPSVVTATISLWGKAKKRFRKFVCKTAIVADSLPPKKVKPPEKPKPQKPEKKANQKKSQQKGVGKIARRRKSKTGKENRVIMVAGIPQDEINQESLKNKINDTIERANTLKNRVSSAKRNMG